MSSNVIKRIKKLQNFLSFGCAAIISSQEGIYYYTGIYSDEFIALITRNKAFIFADKRSFESIPHFLHRIYKPILLDFKAKDVAERISAVHNIKHITFESSVQYAKLKRLKKLFARVRFREKLFQMEQLDRLKAFKNVPCGTFLKDELLQYEVAAIDHLRRIKDGGEIKIMKRSLVIAEEIMHAIRQKIKEGVSEVEIALEIRQIALAFGCQDLSFPPIVAFGRNSSVPHHIATRKRLKSGEIALIDLGVKWKGYCSDITRTFLTGTPSSIIVQNYHSVSSALQKALNFMQSGIRTDKIYALVNQAFREHGVAELFTHAAGHGIGLNIHESPSFSPKDRHKLYKNEILTIEPGLYSQTWGGIRLENMVMITQNRALVLNKLPTDIQFASLRHI